MPISAYCWKSGLIEFGKKVPEGAIQILKGKTQLVKDVVKLHCCPDDMNEKPRVNFIGTTTDDERLERVRACREYLNSVLQSRLIKD